MNITQDAIRKIVKNKYGFECRVKPLAGYVDLNFLLVKEDNEKYLLKFSKPQVSQKEIEFQIEILHYLNKQDLSFDIPAVVPNLEGTLTFGYIHENQSFSVRMHTWVEGKMLSEINPRTSSLLYSWGAVCGELSAALRGFDHPGAHRFEQWNPMETLHSRKHMRYFNSKEEKEMAVYFWQLFEDSVLPRIGQLRQSVNYSDAHEHNLLVNNALQNPEVNGVIDFGDAIYAPTVCELAIACAYGGMYAADPIDAISNLVRGYHSKYPLNELEMEVLFSLISARLMITVANAAYSFYMDPDNDYHQVSARPAWDLLKKLRAISPKFAHYSFRAACEMEPHPKAATFRRRMSEYPGLLSQPLDLNDQRVEKIDLSVGSTELGNNSHFETVAAFGRRITEILEDKKADVGVGGYGEIRPFYTTDAYKVEGNRGPQWRTMHLGIDYWTDEGVEVLAVADGVVHSIQNNNNPCDYGPTLILKHDAHEVEFYTLYGHLSLKTLGHLKKGQVITKGDTIGWIGTEEVNGGWPPHLHFQIILDLLGYEGDFPGVAFVNEAPIWRSLCPSMPLIGDMKNQVSETEVNKILDKRNQFLGRSLSLSYKNPLHMVRGFGVYLYDRNARRYIDTVNNVAHVGHEHPRVVKAAQKQMELLNTNTRYLHENIIQYAEALLSHCPKEMEVVYLVNSGSEANELALRMAKVYTAQKDVIALEMGYHGNTGGCIDISSYKFDGKGGMGAPEYTSICRMPDTYRGEYKNNESAGRRYAGDVALAIQTLKEKGRNIACFIAESILSCGGQIMLPPDYLQACYEMVRSEGGLCIADEVQVGFGRVGSHFWGFELQEVVPDIITCGKPIGNGHPLAAVITTRKVAEAFTNGMEYFNTFGGNPVSCAVGNEVLHVIKDEKLQENAKAVGAYLLKGLERLKDTHAIIGDVRGIGLFLGFELVRDRKTLEPAEEQATYLVNRMRELGVLMSTDGPWHNVIKIKPPMCITKENVDELLLRLDQVLTEDFIIDFIK